MQPPTSLEDPQCTLQTRTCAALGHPTNTMNRQKNQNKNNACSYLCGCLQVFSLFMLCRAGSSHGIDWSAASLRSRIWYATANDRQIEFAATTAEKRAMQAMYGLATHLSLTKNYGSGAWAFVAHKKTSILIQMPRVRTNSAQQLACDSRVVSLLKHWCKRPRTLWVKEMFGVNTSSVVSMACLRRPAAFRATDFVPCINWWGGGVGWWGGWVGECVCVGGGEGGGREGCVCVCGVWWCVVVCGGVWCGVVWCGVVWCGVVCGVVCGVWCVVCGVWCVVCGVWCVVCGVWCVVCGVWCVVCGVWCVVCGVWCVVCGVWCVVCGVWCVVCGVWCVVCGVWCVVCGVWCVVCGVWCVVCGVWCVVCGVWCVVCGVVCGVVWCGVVWCGVGWGGVGWGGVGVGWGWGGEGDGGQRRERRREVCVSASHTQPHLPIIANPV